MMLSKVSEFYNGVFVRNISSVVESNWNFAI